MAGIGQDHRLGANEAPPAIISIFLGAELRKVFETIEAGEGDPATPGSFLGLGTPVLPPLPMHGGDRNRTSPFAFTGNKFEFRALGSSHVAGAAQHGAQHDRGRGHRRARRQARGGQVGEGKELDEAVVEVVREAYAANKQVCFDGDNYAEAWHAEAEKRGLANLRTTPDALPWLVEKQTIGTFERYKVLSERELESRFEVFVEQYIDPKLNIEAETAASIARTMLLPAAVRHLADLKAAGHDGLVAETEELVGEFSTAIMRAREGQRDHPAEEGLELAKYMRDTVVPAMDGDARGRRQARAHRGRRPLAAAEVLGDALHQVGARSPPCALLCGPAPAGPHAFRGRDHRSNRRAATSSPATSPPHAPHSHSFVGAR